MLRFWNNDVLTNIEGVMTVIASALADGEAQEPPTPDPSPPFAARMGGGELTESLSSGRPKAGPVGGA
jgi:hypothetical protein